MSEPIEQLVRPEQCFICNEPLFYAGQVNHVPEVQVRVRSDEEITYFHAHVTCWNNLISVDTVKAVS